MMIRSRSQAARLDVSTSPPRVAFCGARMLELPALWLRERACDPASRDPQNGQRLFDPHLLDDDMSLTAVRSEGRDALWLTFSDGAVAMVSRREILSELTGHAEPCLRVPWIASLGRPPCAAWPDLEDPKVLRDALSNFLRVGTILLSDAPVDEGGVLQVAARFGYVIETNFGRSFQVHARPGAIDLAYTALGLGPHTDNPYRDPVPGIQLLLCRENTAAGGDSTLADGLAAGAALQKADPEGFKLLAATQVEFRYADARDALAESRTIIETDRDGRMTGLNYSPRVDYPPVMPPDLYRRFHRARKALAQLLVDPRFEIRFRLGRGDCIMFDNRRIVHGRTAYEQGSGGRKLEGCYIGHDGPTSLYRVLSREGVE